MARFHSLYVRRSDGRLETMAKGKRREPNQPTEEQLDRKPDKNGVSSYYREVSPDEPKHLDWRRKLGGMLAREMGRNEKSADAGYIMVTFPENYRLYEHVKKSEKDGKTEVKSKTHAAGGNDRQDAYLYGHPTGRKKRYRSPADFFPHLLWLSTDETGDPDNCSCKLCCPEDLDEPTPKARTKQEPDPKIAQTGTTMSRQGSAQGVTKAKSENAPTPVQKPTNTARPIAPTPLPQPKSIDQHIDRQYNSFMYRAGELVWFKRGQAWGLGAVLRRWNLGDRQTYYAVQPLSHPFSHPAQMIKSSNADMRPWLAWSVPKYTNDAINNMLQPPTYDSADWQGIANKQYGEGDIEVDASILAAKKADSSYTPFGPSKTLEPERGVSETYYDGLYLGAEKIWLGDPLRLSIGSGTDILVLHSIQERKRATSIGNQLPSITIHLWGDVYQLQRISHSDPALPTPASASSNPHLPHRLTEDLAFRNARAIQSKHQAAYWKLAATQSRIDLDSVKGRWYEASLLLPILQSPSVWSDALGKGEVQEASLYMNSRGDCQNSNRSPQQPRIPKQNIRCNSRIEAFGRAVPAGSQITDGLQPPSPGNVDPSLGNVSDSQNATMEIDPRFETAESRDSSRGGNLQGFDSDGIHPQLSSEGNQRQHPQQGLTDSSGQGNNPGLDEFMNLDGIEDNAGMSASQDLSGYGRPYGGNQGNFY